MSGAAGEESEITRLGEFGLIRRIVAQAASAHGPGVLVGPGDDSAVIAAADGRVVVSTDLYVEHQHFRTDWSSPEDIGHRCVAAALADVVAMGAAPTGVVIALGLPARLGLDWTDGFTRGVTAQCQESGAALVGGDLTRSDAITVCVTALGDLGGRAPVLRSGAVAGDVLALCGLLGYAAAGLTILSRGFRAGKAFIDAHRRPSPPYAEGRRAADAGARAMCDISDGLIQDLGHIAEASGVSIDVDPDAFEAPPRMVEIASALGADPMSWMLAGGDDHALVATYPDRSSVPTGWRVIGVVRDRDETTDVPAVTLGGTAPADLGWDHFR